MKYLIASDIHGSAFWCGKLIEAFETEKADRLVLLGDILYHGPRNDLPDGYDPKKVIELLNAKKELIMCVRGNCDTEVDQMVLGFPILADYGLLEMNGRLVYLTHGHIYNRDKLPPVCSGDIVIHGHTHIPVCEKAGDVTVMNPGSVAIPKNDSPHSYMTAENGMFIWKNFNGETNNTFSI